MILVTLGTQDKKFTRLLDSIQKLIDKKIIKEKVVVQAGCTCDYNSKDMEIFDLIPMDDFDKLISECDILITHGGVGSIITGLKNDKKVIAAARLKKYGEHTNDHQLQIIENFAKEGYIIPLENFDDLEEILKSIKKFKPKKYKTNSNNFNKLIKSKIDFYIKKKINYKNIINVLFLICIFSFIFLSILKSLIKPIDEVVAENRYANQYKIPNLKDYLSGDLQDNYENSLSDQILYSSKMKNLNNFADAFIVNKFLNFIISPENSDYYFLGNVSLYRDNYLLYNPYDFNQTKPALIDKIDNLNNTMELYPDVDYYFYFIEKDTDIDFRTNEKLGAYEYFSENINSKNLKKFEINNFEEFSNYFYKTDHHWNYKGSYKAYLELLELLDLKKPKKHLDEVCISQNFIGSKGQSTIYYEPFCAYEFDLEEIETKINGEDGIYGHQKDLKNEKNFTATYGGYYGGDDGEIIFNNHDKSKENILIIGNSYDNAILWLLAEKYNKTISIELRNYEHFMNKKFNYSEYLEKYDVDKVLFIGDVYFFTSGEFNVID